MRTNKVREVFLVVLLFVVQCSIALAQNEIVLSVGGSTVISVNSVARVATSAPEVADVTVATSSEVLVNAKKPGTATLYIWDKIGRTTYSVVVRSDNDTLSKEISQAIGSSLVTVKVINKTVVLTGTVPTGAEAFRYERMARAFGLDVINLISASDSPTSNTKPDSPERLKEIQVERAIGIAGVTAVSAGSGYVLYGGVESQMDKTRAEKIAAMFSDKITSFLTVRNPIQVEVEVKVVEVAKDTLKRYGIQFGSYSGGVFVPGTITLSDADVKAILTGGQLPGAIAKLDILGMDNWMKTLANPRMVATAGEKASIHVGGEFPIVMAVNEDRITVEWKPYGIRLDIEPNVSPDSSSVSVKVQPEVSSLDWTNAVKFGNVVIPAIKMRKASTDVRVAEGSTLVMGGLVSNSDATDIVKVPLLGDIPVLGALFRSKEYQKGETELVIFITPRILRPALAMAVKG